MGLNTDAELVLNNLLEIGHRESGVPTFLPGGPELNAGLLKGFL